MLYKALWNIVQTYPDNIALVAGQRRLSYLELWQHSDALAARLGKEGVRQGDRVALLSQNSIEAVIAFWGILKCNAISVYLNEQTPTDGIELIIADAGPRFILATEKHRQEKLAAHPRESVLELEMLVQQAVASAPDACNATDAVKEHAEDDSLIACIVYTSGSTGKPKGVCLTHRNMVSVAGMAGDGYSTTAEDSYLMVVPLHYIHGLMILFTMNLRGASIQFMNSFVFPKLVTRELQQSKVTGFSGVPYHFTALIERGGFLEAELPHLRWIGVTGGSCSRERLAQLRTGQPDIEVHISYGLTECSPRITALEPHKIDTKPDSVGRVANGLTVEFLDDEGQPVEHKEAGELVVSGPNVMHGYWNDDEATARVIDDKGRLHTGDLAYMDDEGDVFIKGRLQAMIKSAWERIFPEELEAVLSQAPEVVDVAVIGVPDARYGQVVEAHVILSPDTDEALESVRAFCLTHVAFARSPRSYVRWQSFPLKANGKIDKQLLAQGQQSV